jgi:hypothetical protein
MQIFSNFLFHVGIMPRSQRKSAKIVLLSFMFCSHDGDNKVHTVLWVASPCSSDRTRRFGGKHRLHIRGGRVYQANSHCRLPLLLPWLAYSRTLNMKAVRSSETSGSLSRILLHSQVTVARTPNRTNKKHSLMSQPWIPVTINVDKTISLTEAVQWLLPRFRSQISVRRPTTPTLVYRHLSQSLQVYFKSFQISIHWCLQRLTLHI